MAIKLKEQKFKWSKKEVYLWLHYHDFLSKAIMIVGASLLLILVGILPMISRFYKTKKLLKTEKDKLENLSQKVTIADNLDQNILAARVKLLNQVLPPTKNVVGYLNTLNSLAKEFNLSLGDISLSPGVVYEQTDEKDKQKSKPNQEGWQVLETELRIIGAKDDIYQFLKQVEKTSPLMIVRDVKMSRVGSKLGAESFVLTLKLGMVYAPPESSKKIKGEIKLLTKEDEQLIDRIKDFKSYPLQVITDQPVAGVKLQRSNLFEPSLQLKSTNQSDLPQEEKPQPQLQLSPESSESSQSSLQNQK